VAIRMQESPDSRDLHYGAQGGGQTFRLTAITTAGETEAQVWIYALQQSEPYFNGFIRQDIKVRRGSGPNYFTVEIEYGPSGVGGGDQPLGGAGNDGGPPTEPTGPGSDTAALKSGWSFSLRVPRLHITQSNLTMLRVARTGFFNGVAPNYRGAIGVSDDGKEVEGCDWPPEPAFTIGRTTARPVVTMGYIEAIRSVLGRPNVAPFYQRAAGEVMLLQADGQYSRDEGWSINWTFGVEANNPNVLICDGLPPLFASIAKKGFEYLWILYVLDEDAPAGQMVKVPGAAYVEQIVEPADYSLLEIGT
jgi:hypothetical protein